jgi:energy-coupling factor transporter ATP-binding protein EcfA2
MLFQFNPEDAASETDRLTSILELEELRDKPIRELSAGDIRKLALRHHSAAQRRLSCSTSQLPRSMRLLVITFMK